jgi:hypothetical protein
MRHCVCVGKDTLEASALIAGLLVGHEFILGKFFIHQRLASTLFDKTPYYDSYITLGRAKTISKHLEPDLTCRRIACSRFY